MELSQVLILYLVILISLISIILLIVLNRTNLRIRFLHEQIKSLQNPDIIKEKNIKNEELEKEAEEIFTTASEKVEITREQTVKKISIFKKKTEKFIESKIAGLEKFTGEKILDKIGIVVFLAGIAFFVSLSMEFDKIDTTGRIFFTLLVSAGMLIIAFLLRNKFASYSSVLMGGGVSVLIFTVFAAFYQYQILNLFFSFLILFGLIGISVFLSIMFNRSEITIIVLLAGFIAPFTVSFNTSDYIILFSYIFILNTGVLIYDIFKKSLVINVVSYAFTFLFFAFWLIREIIIGKDVPEFWAFLFLTIFYIMIFIIIVINNLRENRKFLPLELTALVFGTGMYYKAGIVIIDHADLAYKGLFTALIAIMSFIWVLILYNRKNYDRNLLHLFIGISLIFITLVVPVELVGRSITFIWAIQSCALLWISQKTKFPMTKLSSASLTLAMLIHLGFDFYQTYISTTNTLEIITPILNKGFLTGLVAIASLITSIILLKNETKPYISFPFFKINIYKGILGAAALITFYYLFRFEINYAAIQRNYSDIYVDAIIGIYNFAFLALLTIPSLIKPKIKILNLVSIVAGFITVVIYIIYYNSLIVELRNSYLLTVDVTKTQFNFHYLITFFVMMVTILALKSYLNFGISKKLVTTSLVLVFITSIIYLLSSELDNVIAQISYRPDLLIQEILIKTHRLPYTILWSICSLLFVILGFILQNKEIRTAALFLYAITLIKLFAFDFVYLSNQELMLGLIVLGTVLLAISFVFQLFLNSKRFEKTELI